MVTGVADTPQTQEYIWHWEGQTFKVMSDRRGQGTPILLLPAFSTVSSRSEMQELASLLASNYEVWTVDWPGFGHSSRLEVDYRPALYQQFLQDFVSAHFQQAIAIVAAGHAAGYALQLANQKTSQCSSLILIAPTWRGPLTTMGVDPQITNLVRQAVQTPLLGDALYGLNTLPPVLDYMYREHVFISGDKLTPEFINQKWQITQQPNARFAPAAFVTGGLDPVQSRTEFHALFQGLDLPILVVIGEQSPPKSKAEMEALADLANVTVQRLPGSLGMHEEYATAIAPLIQEFLR